MSGFRFFVFEFFFLYCVIDEFVFRRSYEFVKVDVGVDGCVLNLRYLEFRSKFFDVREILIIFSYDVNSCFLLIIMFDKG